MSDLALGDLRLKVAHMLQNPYVRNKGFLMNSAIKRMVKSECRSMSRKVQASTHYLVDNELFQLIWRSLKRRSIRHFINAFDNAMPPHSNFFVEWGMNDGLFGAHVSKERRQATFRIYETGKPTKKDPGFELEALSVHFYNFSDGSVRIMPIDFWMAPGQPDVDFGGHHSGVLMDDFLDLKNNLDDADKLPSDLNRVFSQIQVQPHIGHPDYLEWQKRPETLDVSRLCRSLGPLVNYETCHQMAFMTLISVISLVNYDWTVNREPGVIVDSVKSVNTSGVAKDQYKQVKLNLPKSKQVLDFFKQKPRTRKFGTAEHVVRGHWRYYKRTGERVWIGEHTRGDSQYGTVHKDYLLTKRDNFLKQPA